MNCIIIIILIVLFLLILYYFVNRCENFIVNSRRILKIFAPNEQMFNIKKKIKAYEKEFNVRNVDIEYVNDSFFKAELYGYDDGLKKTIDRIEDINEILTEIDKMPMGFFESKERKNRKQLLEKCGLPDIPETSHCFNDSTHHTCCMLGPQAREYADNSGNPIGTASINAFGRKPKDGELTPWCTCTGSKVCSYYKNRFNDGTNIKFIGNTNIINEDDGINMLKISRHKTPGIE